MGLPNRNAIVIYSKCPTNVLVITKYIQVLD